MGHLYVSEHGGHRVGVLVALRTPFLPQSPAALLCNFVRAALLPVRLTAHGARCVTVRNLTCRVIRRCVSLVLLVSEMYDNSAVATDVGAIGGSLL